MKTFQSKNLHDSRTVGLLKGLTLLFLGASVAVLATYGLTIDPSINNSVQYIQKIILTSDGTASGATGVVLDGSGNAYFAGKVGIGITNPNAPLQFSNSVVNRKIVLYDSNNNDHQYYGFGVNTARLRYQVDSIFADHVFYAATGAGGSQELMRIKGNGNVGIGTATPQAKLEVVDGSGEISIMPSFLGLFSYIKINGNLSSSQGGMTLGQFTGGLFGQSSLGVFGVLRNGDGNLLLGAGGNPFSGGGINITTGGNVGIGTFTPSATLDVNGTGKFAGNVIVAGTIRASAINADEIHGISLIEAPYPGWPISFGDSNLGSVGIIDAASYKVSGITGVTVSAYISDGYTNTCTLTFVGGLLTTSTCPQ